MYQLACLSTATPLTALPQHQQRCGLLFTRLTGPVNAESRLRTDTHLPYSVLVQRCWRSTLRCCVARRGQFQVTVGAAAPWTAVFGATWHSVLGWLLPLLPLLKADRSLWLLLPGARWVSVRASQSWWMGRARDHPAAGDTVCDQTYGKMLHRDSSRSWKQNERSLRSGMLAVCCCILVRVWVDKRERASRCASPKLRRIRAAFTWSRKLGMSYLISIISLRISCPTHRVLSKWDLCEDRAMFKETCVVILVNF